MDIKAKIKKQQPGKTGYKEKQNNPKDMKDRITKAARENNQENIKSPEKVNALTAVLLKISRL